MTTVTNNIIVTSADVNRASGNVFGQKQAWYKEMEKARQLLTTGGQDKAAADFSDMKTNDDQDSGHHAENAIGMDSPGKPVNASEAASGMSAARAVDLFTGFAASASVQTNSLPTSVDASAMFRILPPSSGNNQSGLMQRALSDVGRIIRSEIQPQNLQFINGLDGIKIYFRDYRLDDSEARKVVEKIRQLLVKLNIEISDIVVNGNIIEQKRAVNQEAT